MRETESEERERLCVRVSVRKSERVEEVKKQTEERECVYVCKREIEERERERLCVCVCG